MGQLEARHLNNWREVVMMKPDRAWVEKIISLRYITGELVEKVCDLPGRVGGARFTQSPAEVLARLLLVHHSAKKGP